MPRGSPTWAASSHIRYAQCWEDADVLLAGLDPQPGDTCLSIASAGDNTLALLARAPKRVVAIDLNPAQLACLDLRVAAYRNLDHDTLLELIGSRQSSRRLDIYASCRRDLSTDSRTFWDSRQPDIRRGIGRAGRFEHYLTLFRRVVLPLVHRRSRVDRLFESGSSSEREAFYDRKWDTPRWRAASKAFFSRHVMGRLGRDPRFFDFAEVDLAALLEQRIRYAATTLDPAENPYLYWILKGRHGDVLPFALRRENFHAIRDGLDRVEMRCQSLESYLAECEPRMFDRANLSDMFEYMPLERYHALLRRLVRAVRPGGRLAYWNLLAPRSRPPAMAGRLRSLDRLSGALHAIDKAFFYNAFVVEQVVG